MSKSSTATAAKVSTQLPTKSAWAKGPPQTTATAPSPRSASPAPNQGPPHPTHSRRPSALGQGVSFKDGVAGARSPTNTVKSASSVTFGSIDNVSAPISSSPAAVPAIKSAMVSSFGSVPATPTANGKSVGGPSTQPTSTSSHPKFDVKKLFQNPSSAPAVSSAPSQAPSDVASPSTRPSPLPQHSPLPVSAQPSQLGGHPPYSAFVAGGGLRPQQNGAPPPPGGPPRSPVFARQMPNGQVNVVNGRPNGTSSAPGAPAPVPAAMSSPRMGPPHGGQPPAGLPHTPQPVPAPGWAPYGYYYAQYPGMPPPTDPYMPYSPAPWMQQHVPTPHQQPQGLPGGPQPGMPMSPRNAPPPLHTPGTPTLTPAVPSTGHPPHTSPSPHAHTSSLSSVSSPPPTPSTSVSSGPGNRLNTLAPSFQPRQNSKIKITTMNGTEVQLDALKKQGAVPPSPVVPASPARKTVIRMEKPEDKAKRLAEEEEVRQKEVERREQEKVKKAEEERRKADEERAHKAKEDEERKKREEEERLRKEKEEKEKEKERVRKEEEEKARKEEERLRQEEEERLKAEEDKVTTARVETPIEPEEGELDEAEEARTASKDAEAPSAAEEATEKAQDKGILRIDTAVASADAPRKRHPGRLDLSGARSQTIPQPLPSALATARIIEDLGSISYPEGIKSPKIELNVNAKRGKFRYDRDFLMQFMKICKDKPDNLPPLDAIGLEPSEQGGGVPMSRGGSQRRTSTAMGPPPSTAARQLQGLGISSFGGAGGNFNMGKFATPSMKTSEERFKESNMSRSTSMTGGPPGVGIPIGGRPAPMVRSSSQGGPSAMSRQRTRSKRGSDRSEVSKGGAGPSTYGSSLSQSGLPFEPVAPLEHSANRWQPSSLSRKQQVDTDSPEVVDRKVRSLLNKLTMERFDSISDQIITWANKSENEHDGRTLIQVIRLVFEKATDEATWSEMYARLCRKMMEQISPKVQDEGIKNTEGKPIAGGQLFRKYLLNRCQEDFERGWAAKETTAAAAATKATEDEAAKAAAAKDDSGETALYSEEYYAAQKAKRQGLGLIKFIGELFKLQMLTERIMHECVKKLLGNVDNPEEEEIESLCKLLTTVGQSLDTAKARAHMDVYFTRMKELTKSPNVNSRMQFMLLDIIELRERKWIPRNQAAAPTTIAAVHAQAAKDTAKEKDAYQRNLSMSRGGSKRGGDRGEHSQVGPDGWAVAGNAAPRPPSKVGDLSHFGKISKTNSMSFGPTGIFAGKDKSKRESASMSRGSSSNMFSKLMENPELATEAAQVSRPPSRKGSVDLGASGTSEGPPQRRKLNLLPRTLPKEESKGDSTPATSEAGQSDDEELTAPSMSEGEVKTRVGEDSKEFFSIRDLDEAEVYFTKLPTEHRWRLVDKLVTSAIESKEADAQLVADFFSRGVSKSLCMPEAFEEGLAPTAEVLDDIAIDAPKAFDLMAIMIKGAQLDEERRTRLASKSMDSDKLIDLLS